MLDLAEKRRVREVNDRRTFLINELNKLGVFVYRNKALKNYDTFTLENIHINEKCRKARQVD